MDLEPLVIARTDRAKGRRTRGWWRLGVFIAALLALVLLWQPLSSSVGAMRRPVVRTVVIERVSTLALTALRGTAANGYVVAARRAALSADAPGRIVELRVTEGTRVEEGELVARLYQDELVAALAGAEARVDVARAEVARAEAQVAATTADLPGLERALEEAQADVQVAEARLELAGSDLARQGELAERNVASARARDSAQSEFDAVTAGRTAALARVGSVRAEIEAARARIAVAEASRALAAATVRTAEADRDLARASLEKTEVRAPFTGLVVLKDAEVGEVVSPNVIGGATARGAICTMVDLESLEVQVEVPETSLAKVAEGAPARVFLDAYPDQPYAGRVSRIWPTANRQKGTVEVRVAFERRDERLRPELGLRVVFLTEEDLADEAALGADERPILLSAEALFERDGRTGAQVLEDGAVHFRPLELGPARFGRVLVRSGVEEGAEVLLPARPELADGTAVRVQA